MPSLGRESKPSFRRKPRPSLGAKQRRETRLATILNQGLPPFPDTVLELSSVLKNSSVDLKKAGELIRTDPSLSAQVLRLCNSPIFGLRYHVARVEQASILLGVDRLRTIAFTCSLVEYAGVGLPREQVNIFWQHSFLAALLSERLAVETNYRDKEHAYIAGLLHDIGQIPQWMLAVEESLLYKNSPPANWPDNTALEREHFGMDHCQIGSLMGVSWNFMPSLVDVLAYHHEPKETLHDPGFVNIVAAVESFLCAKSRAVDALALKAKGMPDDPSKSSAQGANPFLGSDSSPDDVESQGVMNFLEKEYDNLLPLVQLGLKSAIAGLK